jgi:hypothetical protein
MRTARNARVRLCVWKCMIIAQFDAGFIHGNVISLSVVGVPRVVSFHLLGDEGCGRCNHAVPASRAQVWRGLSCAFCLALKQFITATDCVSGTGDLMNDCLLLIQSTHQTGTSGAEHPQIARADPSHAALICSHIPTLSSHPYGLCWPQAHY